MKKIILYLMFVLLCSFVYSTQPIYDYMYLSINDSIWNNTGCNFLGDCGGVLACSSGNNIKSYDLNNFGLTEFSDFNLTFIIPYTNPATNSRWILYDGVSLDTEDSFGVYVETDRTLNGASNISIPKYSTKNNNSGWGTYNLIRNSSGYFLIQDSILLISGSDNPTNELHYFYFNGGAYACIYGFNLNIGEITPPIIPNITINETTIAEELNNVSISLELIGNNIYIIFIGLLMCLFLYLGYKINYNLWVISGVLFWFIGLLDFNTNDIEFNISKFIFYVVIGITFMILGYVLELTRNNKLKPKNMYDSFY